MPKIHTKKVQNMETWILTDHVSHNGGVNNLETNQVISGNQVLAFYTGKTSKRRANKFINSIDQIPK